MNNRYYHKSHVSEYLFKKIVRCFCDDFNATATSKITGVSRVTINRLFGLFRNRIMILTTLSKKMNGQVEIDESYLGPTRVRGKRGRGAGGKTLVLGLLKRNGKVHVSVVNNCSREALMPIIRGNILSKSSIYTDGWSSYDGLVTLGYKNHRIHHHENEFARGKNHVNGIESFWSFTKRGMRKLNGIHKSKFLLHLKESEFRWNNRQNMYADLLQSFKELPL